MAQTVKNPPAMKKTWVRSLSWEDPLEEGMQPTPVFLYKEFHGQRSLAGYSPWRHKELDMTLRLSTHMKQLAQLSVQLHRCFCLQQQSHFIMQHKGFMCTSCFVTSDIRKACTKGQYLIKVIIEGLPSWSIG